MEQNKHVIVKRIEEAEALAGSGEIAEAKTILKEVCLQTDDVRALTDLGVIHFWDGESLQALDCLCKALDTDVTNQDVIENICQIFESSDSAMPYSKHYHTLTKILADNPEALARIRLSASGVARRPNSEIEKKREESLQEIGARHKTDKSFDDGHTYYGLTYLDIYERYFAPLRNEPVNFLEIGVLDGNSLRTFEEYFPKGNIFGLDVNPNCKVHEGGRVKVTIGSQDDPVALESVCSQVDGLDIVIDDGSHCTKHMIASYEYLWPKIKPGGIYIMEDLGCTYSDPDMNWPGMKYNSETLQNDRAEFNEFLNKLAREVDAKSGKTFAIHHWNYIAVMIKVPDTPTFERMRNFRV